MLLTDMMTLVTILLPNGTVGISGFTPNPPGNVRLRILSCAD